MHRSVPHRRVRDNHVGSASLYADVRAHFILQGKTLNRWCSEVGESRQYVEKCLKGERQGPRARLLLARVIQNAYGDT